MSIKGFSKNGITYRYDYEYLDNKPVIDTTLTQTGAIAEAKATGDKIALLQADLYDTEDINLSYTTANNAIAPSGSSAVTVEGYSIYKYDVTELIGQQVRLDLNSYGEYCPATFSTTASTSGFLAFAHNMDTIPEGAAYLFVTSQDITEDTVGYMVDKLDGKENVYTISSSDKVNSMIKELYISSTSEITISRVSCYNVKLASNQTDYLFYLRLYYGESDYLQIAYYRYSDINDVRAEVAATKNKALTFTDETLGVTVYFVFDNSDFDEGISFDERLTYCKTDNLTQTPRILQYIINKLSEEPYTSEMCLSEALEYAKYSTDEQAPFNYSYQCEDQFAEGTLVKVYANGLLVSPTNYTQYKQGKVVFNNAVSYTPSDILFEYEKRTKSGKDYSNDFSANLSGLSKVVPDPYDEYIDEIFTFVPDPTDSTTTVLKIACTQTRSSATSNIFRGQLDLTNINATEIEQEFKMYIPSAMLSAMISYTPIIDWFGFSGGGWCPFGNRLDATTDYFSGSSLSFNFHKLANGTEVVYQVNTKQKYFDPQTREEDANYPNTVLSEFPVKGGEWITVKLNAKVGNPGYFTLTVTDSDGVHTLTENRAYIGLIDPENEATRYGADVSPDIPYRMFTTNGIVKIYTSNELVQYLIDNGVCEIYFKDYILKTENVNAFD